MHPREQDVFTKPLRQGRHNTNSRREARVRHSVVMVDVVRHGGTPMEKTFKIFVRETHVVYVAKVGTRSRSKSRIAWSHSTKPHRQQRWNPPSRRIQPRLVHPKATRPTNTWRALSHQHRPHLAILSRNHCSQSPLTLRARHRCSQAPLPRSQFCRRLTHSAFQIAHTLLQRSNHV